MVPTAAIRRGVFAALLAAASKKAGEGTGELRVYPWGNWLLDERLCSGIPTSIDQSQIGGTAMSESSTLIAALADWSRACAEPRPERPA
jgi:hypothetical protein